MGKATFRFVWAFVVAVAVAAAMLLAPEIGVAGTSWTKNDLSATGQNAREPQVSVSDNGEVIAYAWRRSNGSHWIVQTSYSTDGGATWTNRDLSATGRNAKHPQVSVSGDGKTMVYTWRR
nr:glycoside hydrolase [Actinomycetes bacterium]